MRIDILGSGLMGGKLGTLFSRSGHAVVFSYARNTDKLKRLAKQAGGHALAGPLLIARYTEPFALLMGEFAYGGRNGPELAYPFERFEE